MDVVPLRWFGESEKRSVSEFNRTTEIYSCEDSLDRNQARELSRSWGYRNITLSGVFQKVCKGPVGSALVERDDIGLPVGTQNVKRSPD